jgi:hypothetical protein
MNGGGAMEMDVLSALHSLRLKEVPALKEALVELLIAHTKDEPVSIKKARDTFSHINRRAKQGHIQIIKGPVGEETVIVSVKDLAAMIHATVSGITFADVLDFTGFKPVHGRRLALEEGQRTETELVLSKKNASVYEDAAATV